MKLPKPDLQSVMAVLAGILVTVALVLAVEFLILTGNNGVATLQVVRQIWVLDVMAAVFGGYLTAQIAPHSPLKHASAVTGIILPPIAVLGYLSAEPLLHILITSLGFGLCILLGAVARDWQRQRSRRYAA